MRCYIPKFKDDQDKNRIVREKQGRVVENMENGDAIIEIDSIYLTEKIRMKLGIKRQTLPLTQSQKEILYKEHPKINFEFVTGNTYIVTYPSNLRIQVKGLLQEKGPIRSEDRDERKVSAVREDATDSAASVISAEARIAPTSDAGADGKEAEAEINKISPKAAPVSLPVAEVEPSSASLAAGKKEVDDECDYPESGDELGAETDSKTNGEDSLGDDYVIVVEPTTPKAAQGPEVGPHTAALARQREESKSQVVAAR